MILFYSDYCPHCRMLLEEVKRRDVRKVLKLVSVDTLKIKGSPLLSKIHSVPALLLFQDNKRDFNIIFDRAVFDTLISPNGILSNMASEQPGQGPSQPPVGHIIGGISGNELPFTDEKKVQYDNLQDDDNTLKASFGTMFASITETNDDMKNSSFGGNAPTPVQLGPPQMGISQGPANLANPFSEPADKFKSSLPDLDRLRQERTMDVQKYVNTNALMPPAAGR